MLNRSSRLAQRGLSLVELMVGIAVGLFVVAGAGLVVSTQLGENRRLLLETQLQQDLRASMDIITRELRRAGSWTQAQQGVWQPNGAPVAANAFNVVAPDAVASSELTFSYRRGPGVEGPFGFKWDVIEVVNGIQIGAIRSLIGGVWQELTDSNVMNVTAFTVTPLPPDTYQIPCPRACSADPTDTACWPTLSVRSYVIDITARARHDPAVQRSLSSQVRLRNDRVLFDPANPAQACPT